VRNVINSPNIRNDIVANNTFMRFVPFEMTQLTMCNRVVQFKVDNGQLLGNFVGVIMAYHFAVTNE
jgi:hypothetical protein